MSNLAELVGQLARARVVYYRMQLEEVEAQNRLLDLPEYQLVLKAAEQKKAAMYLERLATDAVREAALATGEKQPHPAVQVKAYQVVDTTDAAAAFEHCRVHLPQAVKLDSRAVEKLVKAGVEIPGTAQWSENRATIASDLNEYVGEGDA